MRPLPPTFATRDGYDIVRLWNCHPIPDVPAWSATGARDGPAYRITPCALSEREHQRYEVPGLIIEDARRGHGHGYATLVTDALPRYRYIYEPVGDTVIYRGDWVFIERTLYSWYHGAPIPVVEFTGRHPEWPHTDANVMEYRLGERRELRQWIRRWTCPPDRAESPEHHVRGPAAAAPAPPPAVIRVPTEAAPKPLPPVAPLPKFVADLLIADAIAKSSVCPITMEPITAQTAATTSCFHVFDANAIAIWLTNESKCPTCKSPCVASVPT